MNNGQRSEELLLDAEQFYTPRVRRTTNGEWRRSIPMLRERSRRFGDAAPTGIRTILFEEDDDTSEEYSEFNEGASGGYERFVGASDNLL